MHYSLELFYLRFLITCSTSYLVLLLVSYLDSLHFHNILSFCVARPCTVIFQIQSITASLPQQVNKVPSLLLIGLKPTLPDYRSCCSLSLSLSLYHLCGSIQSVCTVLESSSSPSLISLLLCSFVWTHVGDTFHVIEWNLLHFLWSSKLTTTER